MIDSFPLRAGQLVQLAAQNPADLARELDGGHGLQGHRFERAPDHEVPESLVELLGHERLALGRHVEIQKQRNDDGPELHRVGEEVLLPGGASKGAVPQFAQRTDEH